MSELQPGETIGRYKIVRLIARGGMGEIYLGRSLGAHGFQTSVVIKRLPPDQVAIPENVDMFLDEARVGARLVHPNVARVFDFGEDAGSYYLIMEHVDGANLRQICKRCALCGIEIPLSISLQIVLGVAAGLHAAHSAVDSSGKSLGIVHRDVSPHNVVISRHGDIKLIDFGIARVSRRRAKTEAGVVKGKFAYMSPEQCALEPMDHRSDIYSLGVLLYELTTGAHPYRHCSTPEIVERLMRDAFPDPRQTNPAYPKALSAIIRKMTHPNPEMRYQSLRKVDDDIRFFVAREGMCLSPHILAEWISQPTKTPVPHKRGDTHNENRPSSPSLPPQPAALSMRDRALDEEYSHDEKAPLRQSPSSAPSQLDRRSLPLALPAPLPSHERSGSAMTTGLANVLARSHTTASLDMAAESQKELQRGAGAALRRLEEALRTPSEFLAPSDLSDPNETFDARGPRARARGTTSIPRIESAQDTLVDDTIDEDREERPNTPRFVSSITGTGLSEKVAVQKSCVPEGVQKKRSVGARWFVVLALVAALITTGVLAVGPVADLLELLQLLSSL